MTKEKSGTHRVADLECASRRRVLAGIAGLAGVGLTASMPKLVRAQTAKFRYKLGISLPDASPIVIGMRAAAADVLRDSGGKLDIQVFPNGQLGGDASMVTQLRQGSIELVSTGLVGTWGNFVPAAGLPSVPFAFTTNDALWKALDGDLTAYIGSSFSAINLVGLGTPWEIGFRHITTNSKPIVTPQDLNGLKIRVPQSPILISTFTKLGASPTPISFQEVYSALQTKLVNAQENPLTLVESAKLYEVQKFCSLTSHSWEAHYIGANKRAWEALPPELRQLVTTTFHTHALKARSAVASENSNLVETLKKQGMGFNNVDPAPFRQTLQKAGFYSELQSRLGAEGWARLEKYSGKLS
ncbi:TRAP transporter substrate-binding protein [Caballeronia sp. J97]|uniref:TRAP transporter substrate-binding protein n=1 Tax=Caballeronia sp. J97 TaxID=2805429 RepID=UPI002AB2B173|nr:TRAP transporter substrate-binding protein [Caballeronia sp. J97]